MIVLYIMATIVFLRAVAGKEIAFSRRRLVPGRRARWIAIALLPLLALGASSSGLMGIGLILYILSFCAVAAMATVKIES